ncbi:GLPGLI family protein [Persicitalea sp.]|uniref:GLPGLI family protein n=1 Tax=Persicitalea sp. TaxID=3100273 RepID=UPI0035935D91
MKQKLAILFLTLLTLPSLAQEENLQGVISYEQVYHWTKIYSRMDYMSQEEKDRMKLTWGNDDESKTKMTLFFTPSQTKYTYDENQDDEDRRYSWRKNEYLIYRDFEQETKTEIIEMLGKTYVIEDSLKAPKWKVMNKIKEVAGHLCMLATTEDTIKKQKIEAWFSHDLPISAGPGQYFGLPGLIMELDVNEGDLVITATKVEMRPVAEEVKLPKKIKGRKLTSPEYDELIWTHIRDSMTAHRNPFWAMPY